MCLCSDCLTWHTAAQPLPSMERAIMPVLILPSLPLQINQEVAYFLSKLLSANCSRSSLFHASTYHCLMTSFLTPSSFLISLLPIPVDICPQGISKHFVAALRLPAVAESDSPGVENFFYQVIVHTGYCFICPPTHYP